MDKIREAALDNPVWHALSAQHLALRIGYEGLAFYHPDYCPFGAFADTGGRGLYTGNYETLSPGFFIVGQQPVLPSSLQLNRELVCCQMVMDRPILLDNSDNIVTLDEQHYAALFDLVNLVQPGYFASRTALMGDYFGIFQKGQLVAVTGERMKMNNFTEVSAVVTRPGYTGKGYAKKLVAHTVNSILQQNKTAFLHVVKENVAAIQLYHRLGFITRREISFWHVTSKEH